MKSQIRKNYNTGRNELLSNRKSLSIRMTEKEYTLLDEIVNKKNANSKSHCRISKTQVVHTVMLNWIIDNKDNDEPFPEHPFYMFDKKHNI